MTAISIFGRNVVNLHGIPTYTHLHIYRGSDQAKEAMGRESKLWEGRVRQRKLWEAESKLWEAEQVWEKVELKLKLWEAASLLPASKAHSSNTYLQCNLAKPNTLGLPL